jgi:catechol 2,3-dioxygenase-like lactoylglutathione lyase family enzyme
MIRRSQKLKVVLISIIVMIACVQVNLVHAQRPQSTTDSTVQFHHVTLSVSDVDRVSHWYADVLGFQIRDRFTLTRPDNQKIQIVRVEIPGLRMNISQFPGFISPERSGENQGWRHLALQVDNIDQSYQRLQKQGVQFLTEPFTYDPPGYRIAFFRDLEGNILELYQDL